jgi:hypothetical protein
MSGPSSRGCVANEWRRVWAGALGETSVPDRRVPECALQDGLVQVVALPGDPIKVHPRGAWTRPRLRIPPIADGPMPTLSLNCGRWPTIACGRRSGKERPRLYGCRDTGLGRPWGLVERLHMAGRTSREDSGSHPLERRRLFRAVYGLGRYLEAEVE